MFRTKVYESNIFIGKTRKSALKMQLLYFLSNHDRFSTSREITTELGLKSPHQTQQLLRELEEDLKICYPNKEFQLIINQTKGVQLIRSNGDLQLLLNSYHYSELSYDLLTDLFYESPITVQRFCEKHFVSEATTRRKVRQVNKNLETFNIHITVGRQLTLVGKEEHIRAYYLLTNNLTYQSILNLPIEENQQKDFVRLVSSFVHQKNLKYSTLQIEMIALLYGTQVYRINKGFSLNEKPSVIQNLDDDFFPEKPIEFDKWSTNDWQYFIFILYVLNLYFPTDSLYTTYLLPTYQEELMNWTSSFTFFFQYATEQLPHQIEKDLVRLLHFNQLYTGDIYLFYLFPLLSIEELTERYPLHMNRFNHFWTAFIYTYPHLNYQHFKINSLLLTLSLVPLEQRKESIYIYLECPLSNAYVEHLKTSIIERVQAKYHVNFVEHESFADLTISTMKHFTMPANPNFLSVHPLLFENDYLLIEDAIQNFFSYDSPENVIDITE